LVQHYLGVAFEKKKRLQRSRWDQRPLTDEQIRYAVQDTALLLPLYEILQAELDARGLRQEAERVFEEVCRVEWTPKTLDRRGHARISGYTDMSPEQQRRLKRLYRWRFEKAFQTDRAAFMILSDADMVTLVKEADEGPLDRRVRDLPLRGQANRYLDDIVNIINE
jgi:ribonuclease D